ncbi:MAG: hypothetical protein A2Y38_17380 [Spirochaetes bacterium GWB1_59_5]|nr:MAG: hypothetical protein A2Y38_17380 [Spirochaetes bacterium GWB1_59_5]
MTIGEAAAAGIARLRRDPWNPAAYILINIMEGCYGPWATLFDVEFPEDYAKKHNLQDICTPMTIPLIGMDDYVWEPFVGKRHSKDTAP